MMLLSNKLLLKSMGLIVLALVCMGVVHLKDSSPPTQDLEEILHELSTMTLLPSLQNRKKPTLPQKPSLRKHTRALSIDLGNGDCRWTTPVEQTARVSPTFLVGFPGSGKRFSYKLVEALTGTWAGDDWDHSKHGYNVALLKGAYPHHESSPWIWRQAQMSQVILQVRNPRWAFISYRSMRAELDYSQNWDASHDRVNYVYTFGGPIDHFEGWKQAGGVAREIALWSWHIDFWMEGGLLRNAADHSKILDNGQDTYDVHCQKGGGSLDCKPVEVVRFEALENRNFAPEEMAKIGNALDGQPGVTVISNTTWECLYDHVVTTGALRDYRFDPYRDQHGPHPRTKTYDSTELSLMLREIMRLNQKYSAAPWRTEKIAQELVEAIRFYARQIQTELVEVRKVEAGIVT